MKRIHDNTRIAELFVKAGLIAAIAAALLLPTAFSADGAGTAPPGRSQAPLPGQRAQAIAPSVPHLTAIPWLTRERAPKGPKIDTLVPAPAGAGAALATGLPPWPPGSGSTTTETNG